MSYIDDVVRELRKLIEKIEPGRAPEVVVTFVKQKVAESYRNGMQAADRIRAAKRTQADGARGLTGRSQRLR